MDRRTFLKTAAVAAGVLGGGTALTACAGGVGSGGDAPPGGEPTLSVITGSYEILRDPERTIAFGIRTLENEPVEDGTVRVWLRDADGETVLGGPVEAEYTDDAGQGLGIWLVTLDLSTENVPVDLRPFMVAAHDDAWGETALNVVAPEDSQLLVPGDEAIAVPTPTVDDPLGYATICTQEPACGMHETSLDTALSEGRPVVLLFATPAYCQTAVCGPAVGTVDQVRQSQDWGDTAFIHVEIFTDEGQTVGDPVTQWQLPTEPWLFTVGADGAIADRLDGPMVPSVVAGMAEEIGSA